MKVFVLKLKNILVILILLIVMMLAILKAPSILRIMYPLPFETLVEKYANEFRLDPYFVYAVIKTESNFKPEAKSSKEARGLMQITGDTGKWAAQQLKRDDYNSDKLYEPEYNIMLGCWYLDYLMQQFDGNVELVAAAYNAGDGNVRRWQEKGSIEWNDAKITHLPFPETKEYVRRVRIHYFIYKTLYHNNQR